MGVLNVIAGPGPRVLGHIRLLEPENGPRASGVHRSSAFSAFDVTPSCQSYPFESGVHKVAAGHRLNRRSLIATEFSMSVQRLPASSFHTGILLVHDR